MPLMVEISLIIAKLIDVRGELVNLLFMCKDLTSDIVIQISGASVPIGGQRNVVRNQDYKQTSEDLTPCE